MEIFSNSTLAKLSNGFTFEKRFETEFEKIDKIGIGGFASVYKVKNILDNSMYAIKKIKIKIDSKNKEFQKDVYGVLQEARFLAKFRSEYIVTYNHSWVELKLKEVKRLRKLSNEGTANFEKDDSWSWTNKDYLEKKISEFDKRVQFDSGEEFYNGINMLKNSLEEIECLCMYIQMELCKETLGDYLEKRNKKYFSSCKRISQTNLCGDKYIPQEEIEIILQVFKDIILGVEYIHNKENLIHRDIKPNNIFFTFEGHIKIGDLGLATNSLNKNNHMMTPSPINRSLTYGKSNDYSIIDDDYALDSSFKLEMEENRLTSLNNTIEDDNENSKNTIQDRHTRNVGTSQYSAPEQLNNNYYNNKVDIYSLGLVLFEMLFPYKTKMEKHLLFDNLKNKRILPKEIIENFGNFGELILKMTDIDPEIRPNIFQTKVIWQNISQFYSLKSYESEVFANSEKLYDTSDKKSKSFYSYKERRARFLSEDINSILARKFLIKINDKWENAYILINDVNLDG